MSFTAFLDYGNGVEWYSMAALIVFLVSYTIYTPWWKHPVGWVVNIFALSLTAIIGPSLIALSDPSGFANFAATRWYQVLETFNLTFIAASATTGILVWRSLHKQRRLPGEEHGGKKE